MDGDNEESALPSPAPATVVEAWASSIRQPPESSSSSSAGVSQDGAGHQRVDYRPEVNATGSDTHRLADGSNVTGEGVPGVSFSSGSAEPDLVEELHRPNPIAALSNESPDGGGYDNKASPSGSGLVYVEKRLNRTKETGYRNEAMERRADVDYGEGVQVGRDSGVGYSNATVPEGSVGLVYGDETVSDGGREVVYAGVASGAVSAMDYGSEPSVAIKGGDHSVQPSYPSEAGSVVNSVHYSPPQTTSGDGYDPAGNPLSPHFADDVAHLDDDGSACFAAASKRLVEMYCATDDDLPSTTSESAGVDAQPSSLLIVKSSPYHHQRLDEYSPEHSRPTSSTENYTMPIDTFEPTPCTSYHHHHHHHRQHQHHDELRHYAARVVSIEEDMEVAVEPTRSPPIEMNATVSSLVSSSATSHHVVVVDTASTLIHAEDVRDERFAVPQPLLPSSPPPITTSGIHHLHSDPLPVSHHPHHHHQQQQHHHQSQHQHHHLIEVDHRQQQHHLVEDDQMPCGSDHGRVIGNHEEALHEDAGNGRHHHHQHHHHEYYDDGQLVEEEPLDQNLVRLVNQRLPTLVGPNMLTDPVQKQLLVESVVRSMMGVQARHLFLADGSLNGAVEEPIRPTPAPHDAGDYYAVPGQHQLPSQPNPIGALDEAAVSVDHGLVDSHRDHQVAQGSREATPPDLNDASLVVMPSASGMISTTTTARGLLLDDQADDSMVQVLHVSEATSGQSYVSSSTGGVEHEHHVLSRHATTLDATVDSTVEMEVATSDDHYRHHHHHSTHTQNLVVQEDAHYVAAEIDHSHHHHHHLHPHQQPHEVTTVELKYSSTGMTNAEHHYAVVNHQMHPHHHHHHHRHLPLDSAGVSTTAEDDGDTLLVAQDPRYAPADPSDPTPSSSNAGRLEESEMTVAGDDNGSSSSINCADAMVDIGRQQQQQPHMQLASASIADNVVAEPLALSRPRRQLAKHRLANAVKVEEPYDPDTISGCEKCNLLGSSVCTEHRVRPIFDKPVLTRAWASLPASYLSITKVSQKPGGESVYGVFAKKTITKRTQFGPLEGVPVAEREVTVGPRGLVLQIEMENGEMVGLDVGDESLSNWMRFVRPADCHAEQNLVLVQQAQSLFYTSTTDISPRTELRLGYSAQYASRRGLTVLDDGSGGREISKECSWPCFECNQKFASSVELQDHLNEHDNVPPKRRVVVENGGEAVANVASPPRKKAKSRAAPSNKLVKKVRGRLASKKIKTPLDALADATGEALARRPRGRPPKKFRSSESTTRGEFECNFCHKVFPRPYSLQRHIAMHSGEKKFKCNVCEMKFTHVYNRNRHMRRHRAMDAAVAPKKPFKLFKRKRSVGVNEWVCTHCDLTFNNPSLLNLHTLTHAAEDVGLGEDPPAAAYFVEATDGGDSAILANGVSNGVVIEVHECPQCTQEFFTRKELIEHASTHGKMPVRKSFRGLVNPAKPYKCELCYKSFATEDRLQRHMLVHGNEEAKPLKCMLCEKRFLNNSALACHIKVHSDEKKFYECPICREEFDQIVTLKDHIRIHSINGLYTCPHCQKAFDEYTQIRKHIRAFHSEKKFPCGYCDKIFPRPDKLKLHMLRHSTHREFLCANCGKQFKRKDKLKEHMKRMHSIEREARLANKPTKVPSSKKFIPKVSPNDYHRFIYKCHACLLGFKRRGMLVNHLAKRHPGIRPESVPELNLPILKTTRDYYCQYCEKVYKSSSKRKAHILKQHPGADLPMSNRRKGGIPEIPGVPNPTFSQTVGSITTHPHNCEWCHKQYASKAKLLQHQRKKHLNLLPNVPRSHHRDMKSEEEEEEEQERMHQQQHQQFVLQHQMSATTQTSDMDAEVDVDYDEGVIGSHMVDADATSADDTKPTILTTIRGASGGGIYVSHGGDDGSVVVATSDIDTEQVDALPPADLLTQAMSELTQSLVVEYRGVGIGAGSHLHHQLEYSLDRVTQSCPPAMLAPSPTTTPGPPTVTIAEASPSQLAAIEQSQLGRLLGHYEDVEASTVTAMSVERLPSEEEVAHSSVLATRSWTTYADYPAR